MAIRREIPVTKMVPITIAARPNEPFPGFQLVENNSSGNEASFNRGKDRKKRIKNMIKKRSEIITVISSISFIPMKSRILLLSITINCTTLYRCSTTQRLGDFWTTSGF
jgi:hypothetical protein